MAPHIETNPHLRVETHGSVGFLTLDRPQALNALTLGMIRGIHAALDAWRDDDGIRAIIIRGAGDRAFCAGGDVKAVYEAGVNVIDPDAKTAIARVYFADEYRMNRALFHYPKPIVAFMNGIAMGGGYGVAGPCRFRIASEKTLFAMPEVGIGFFPDVGSVYFLTRTSSPGVGLWLALTGQAVPASDMLYAGLADVFVPSADHDDLMTSIIHAVNASVDAKAAEGAIAGLLPTGNGGAGASALARNAEAIVDVFKVESHLENILQEAEKSENNFINETMRIVKTRAPLSLKITHNYIHRMQGASFDAVTAMDYRLAIAFMRDHDFYEGIRAALVDKDKDPHWNPSALGAVSAAMVEAYFSDQYPDLDGL
ncbi:enoyl-CoA hydratase/isomerase family protein [Micavibrio aeruginosavorus]|uniref:enoyl-CoA hydratase/isomerase family protein n=1 Tax=Micavibrio aeruginosavorus TaxID=349221 RepID=UPI003F4ACE64